MSRPRKPSYQMEGIPYQMEGIPYQMEGDRLECLAGKQLTPPPRPPNHPNHPKGYSAFPLRSAPNNRTTLAGRRRALEGGAC
jgi:hypothetical protein